MNSKRLRFFSLTCSLAIIAGSLLPGGLVQPAPASAGIMRWDTVTTPNSTPNKNDVLNPVFAGVPTGSEIRDLRVGNDGKTLIAAVTVDNRTLNNSWSGGAQGIVMSSNNRGISWTTASQAHLMSSPGWTQGNHVYNVCIAPDDTQVWAVTSGNITAGPVEVWVSADAGANWSNTSVPDLDAGEAIGAIDISVNYGAARDFAIGTRSGSGTGRLFIMKSGGFSTWMEQTNRPESNIDYFAIKFSPSYNGDNSIAVVYADDNQTNYNVGVRDINNNSISTWVFPGGGIEVKSGTDNISPSFSTLGVACLRLPSDFSGQSSNLRRAFISTFAPYFNAGDNRTGIFRIDDASATALYSSYAGLKTQVYSIDFFGTYASGKLLAGMAWGSPCMATVPTMFADTPCTCAGSCLYQSLKPPTGAGNQGGCNSENLTGIGSALVAWNSDGAMAYAATGSGMVMHGSTWWNSPDNTDPLDSSVGAHPWLSTLIPNDETALSITRNNGDTWNQLALIDTTIDWFNDFAVSADCSTMYLASVSRNEATGCAEFDSVWRYTQSTSIASPLPALLPVGAYWERVLCRTTSYSCRYAQSDLPILRTPASCLDSQDGGVVGWAAQYAAAAGTNNSTVSGGIMSWSPDYGDYWVSIVPRHIVQDFAFDSNHVMYTVNPGGLVQRLVYTGTAWSTSLASSSIDMTAHTIAARDGKVLVGSSYLSNNEGVACAYSVDSAKNWYTYKNGTPSGGNVHVIFDVGWDQNFIIYAATDNRSGTIYRNTAPAFTKWQDGDLMDISNGASGSDWWSDNYTQANGDPPHCKGYYGVVMAFTGDPQPALYGAHDNISISIAPSMGELPSNSAVCRTIEPRNGMPKPGVYWDCLDIFAPASQNGVSFTLEPSSLKSCGCCSLDSNTSLWAIDNESGAVIDYATVTSTENITVLHNAVQLLGKWNNHKNNPSVSWDSSYPGYTPELNQGMLWTYTDCLAKKGPALRKPVDQALVGADPVTGRNQQIDLSWEQLCLSNVYQIQVAKDEAFTLRIDPQINNASIIQSVTGSILVQMDSVNVTNPAVWIAPGALPEAGAVYYWRIRTYQSVTRQIAVSPWSETRSFRIKPGFVVNTPYYGVQLLAPDNGCFSCKVKPASFSWSPWKEATRYEFVLAEDSEFTKVVRDDDTATTGYEYDGTLEYDTNYFWRVRAVEINGQPITSDWSATFSFKTESAPAEGKAVPEEPVTPLWVWAIIAVGTVLVIVTLILLLRTRG